MRREVFSKATEAGSVPDKIRQTSIWNNFDTKPMAATLPCQQRDSASQGIISTSRRQFRWVVDAAQPIALIFTAGIAVLLPSSLSTDARLALFAFLLAAILWVTTSINAAYIALSTITLLIVAGGSPQEQLFESLASHVIWLMIGAFILGGAVQKTGLAARLTQFVASRGQNVSGIFWLLTTVLILLSFLIPSTSGRAAVMTPFFLSISSATEDKRIIRALAILMPTIILVSTIVALVGAGSHLVANDLLYQIANERISFTQWAIYGLPFGLVASYLSCWIILHLFLDRQRREQELKLPQRQQKPLSQSEIKTLIIVILMIAFWLTESWHGFEIATVNIIGALLLTCPGIGVLKWKDGLKAVSWNLIIFVGAALVLGKSLINSGAAEWIIDRLFIFSSISDTDSHVSILILLTLISLTSHLYMTSHTARAAALVPALLYLASSLQLNPTAVMFLGTVGMDYCLTFPVSSKALLIFQEMEQETYQPADLLRLSAILMLAHLGLIVLFYYTYWRWVGLQL